MKKKNTNQQHTSDLTNGTVEENITDMPSETPETTEVQVDELSKVKEELASAKDQNLRLYAEFENFRRRNAKERIELITTANLDMMQAILPVVDDFERALKNIEHTEANKSLFEGVELIYNKLIDTLKSKGLKPMDTTTGQTFDVETMEAITRIPAPNKDMHNVVMDEVERGYLLGEKVIRYAKVVVGHKED